MTKRLLALVLVAGLSLSMIACGKEEATEDKKETSEKTETKVAKDIEYDVDDYVTLGDYKGVEVTLTGDYEYTEEGFNNYLADSIGGNTYVPDDSQTEVKKDSIVNVDYVGSQNGVPFDGGSAEDQTLDVANNCMAGSTSGFIDGFTAGLPGHSVGEEVEYEVTFPEDYMSADLAGQTVVFTFKINYIAKMVGVDGLTDDYVKENLGYDTLEEYKASVKEQYEESLAANKEADIKTAVQNTVVNNAKVSGVPQELLDAWVEIYINSVEKQYAANYGKESSIKDIMSDMGQDYDEYMQNVRDGLTDSIETILVFQAVCKAEGIELDEKAFEDYFNEIITESGAPSREEFIDFYSLDNYAGENYFKTRYYAEQGLEFCVDNAVVTVEEN